MRAWLSEAAGPAETLQLRTIETPHPARGQVRVAIRACGINFPDTLIIEDRYQYRPPRPFSPGSEVAGIVDAVGEDVDRIAPGMRVCGSLTYGGLADTVLLDAKRCVPLPEDMSFADGATLLTTHLTAYHALVDCAGLRAGETVLVLGAAGGTGTAAIQIARALGALPVAAVSSEEKLAFCLANGAASGLVYPGAVETPADIRTLAERMKAQCGAEGPNVVFDAIGGGYAEAALRAIGWQGRHLVIGFTAGIPRIPLNLPLLKGSRIIGVFLGRELSSAPDAFQRLVDAVTSVLQTGRIRRPECRAFDFAHAPDAIRHLASREAKGKVVVTVDDVASEREPM